ncbi:hypothetical protein [Hyphomicrobium sp. ghe19]|uniref:hypothetical protein n=1 Tax=Hyphomicrobium sp. ghe19 TaxID=2682968 RepID=UPI001366F860|nr:hypothetical protein HYPP_02653 [Hyphomicrobium sp. ghe19]
MKATTYELDDVTTYLTDVVVPGYDSVLSHMARTRPEEIEEMIDAVVDTIRINRMCARKVAGSKVIMVQASPILQEAGIGFIQAFPIDVIEEVLSG